MRTFAQNQRRLGLEVLEHRRVLSADIQLVKDISPAIISSEPQILGHVGDIVFFAATTSTTGMELWRTDGTEAGTFQLADIYRGAASGLMPQPFETVPEHIVAGDFLYFVAGDGVHGGELWKSDGTTQGTALVKDIRSGSASSNVRDMAALNGVVYFVADYDTFDDAIWRSDGTEAGTQIVVECSQGSIPCDIGHILASGNLLYYTTGAITLWKSDGTAAGTSLVKHWLDFGHVEDPGFRSNFVDVNGTVFFRADGDDGAGMELWKSDGTLAGTVLVKDIGPNIDSNPNNLTNVDGTLFFTASGSNGDVELWKSDGTSEGTVRVRDIRVGGSSNPHELTNVDGTLFFQANGGHATRLWKSDGTEAGTVEVAHTAGSEFTAVGSELYFRNSAGLYKSDGTAEGTSLVLDANGQAVVATGLYAGDGAVYFKGTHATAGSELWRSDGTAAGTRMIKDIHTGTANSQLRTLEEVNGKLIFTEGSAGRLWASDGTDGGTLPIGGVNHRLFLNDDRSFEVVGQVALFRGDTSAQGFELWRTDGTLAGTTIVADIRSGTGHSYPRFLTNFNGIVYFSAGDAIAGTELWRTDGTLAGTQRVRDIVFGSNSSDPENLVVFNGKIYFRSARLNQLWMSDGTSAGTVPVVALSRFEKPVVVGDSLFFRSSSSDGIELWKSDGTAAGTVQVMDILPGNGNGLPSTSDLIEVNGVLYFAADDGVSGLELWKSDGTEAGTVRVKDILPGAGASNPTSLTALDGWLYFSADDGVGGKELWKSDGTEAGTMRVLDIYPGASSSSPSELLAFEGKLYFTADDGSYGRELWQSDGTPEGTRRRFDPTDDPTGRQPAELAVTNRRLYFTAISNQYGNELYVTRLSTPPSDLLLSNQSVVEDDPIGTVVGTFQTIDADSDESFTYQFASGEGSQDNSHFLIVGATLRTNGTFDYLSKSSYSIRVRSTDSGGQLVEAVFEISILPETKAPQVINVYARSSSWITSFVNDLGGGGNSSGFDLLTNQTSLPWTAVDTFTINLSENVIGLTEQSVEVRNSHGPLPINIAYDSALRQLVINLENPVSFGKLRIAIADSVTDPVGNQLDGDNDGMAGGIFDLRLDVLAGDANADGRTSTADLQLFAQSFNNAVGDSAYLRRANWNGDNRINTSDLGIFASYFNSNLSSLAAPAPAFSGSGQSSGRFLNSHAWYFASLGDGEDEEKRDKEHRSRSASDQGKMRGVWLRND